MHVDEPRLLILARGLEEGPRQPCGPNRRIDDVWLRSAIGVIDPDGAAFTPLRNNECRTGIQVADDFQVPFRRQENPVCALVARLREHCEARCRD